MRKFTLTTVACVSMFTGVAGAADLTLHLRGLQSRDVESRLTSARAFAAEPAIDAKFLPQLMARIRDADADVRESIHTAIAKIGAPAVPELIEMLQKGDIFPTGTVVERAPEQVAMRVLERMDQKTKTEVVIPALLAKMEPATAADDAWVNNLEALGRMGPGSLPAMRQLLDNNIGLSLLADKMGEAAKPAADRLLESYSKEAYLGRWKACQALANLGLDASKAPAILKLMEEDEYGLLPDLSLVLDRMGPAAVPAIVALLNDKNKDWYPRWGATIALEMMGPTAKSAAPALDAVLKDNSEDIDLRVGAARALARIQGTEPITLYQQIPNLQQQLIKTTHEKSLAYRKAFMKAQALREDVLDPESTYGRWEQTARIVYRLASNVKVEEANRELKKLADSGWNGAFMDVNLVRAYMIANSKSEIFPGRLTPETEAAMKKYFFVRLENLDKSIKQHKEQGQTTEQLSSAPAFSLALHANKPMNFTSRDYIGLGVLKDDPEYKDRTFTAGDTVQQRYAAWNKYFGEFLHDWALNGMWVELGSTSYEYHTYPSFVNLADFAPDPQVRQRAKMYLDLILAEAQQISIADLRAGSKSRAKKGGLGSNFNPYLHMIFGERGRPLFHAPVPASTFQAPDIAILLHKLGPTVPVFEITNRQAGEITSKEREHMKRGLKIDSHIINYAYRTPEYIMGCSMYDPNLLYGASCEGRWSGVVFRNRAIISLPAYSGEKWNVQSRDVMITQKRAGGYYGGFVRIELTSGFDKVERDGWIFLNNGGDSFAAIKVVNGGYTWNDPIKGSIGLVDSYSPIIIQTGRAADYQNFDRFQEAILKAPLKVDFDANKQLQRVEYTGPNSAKVEFVSNSEPFVLPSIDGKPIDLVLTENYRSPYLQSVKGSHVVTLSYGQQKWTYDFQKNVVVPTSPAQALAK